jgi:hypothetical protein
MHAPAAIRKTVDMSIGPDRVWSWATTESEVDQRRQHAEQLVGQHISRVRYYTLDYRREELHPELIDSGPRFIDADSEWNQPTWRYDGFDAMDFGIELETDTSALFALTWDPPGYREGIGLQKVAMLGGGVRRDADVAIWDVSTRSSNWRPPARKGPAAGGAGAPSSPHERNRRTDQAIPTGTSRPARRLTAG